MDRTQALELVNSWTTNQNLVKHMLCVEACMHGLAAHFNEDEDLWGVTGLVHDADYESNPTEHPWILIKELEKNQENPLMVQAIKAHAWQWSEKSPEPTSNMDWSLYCCDELSGLIIASTLVLPERRLSKLTVESVLKKFPNKSFAKGVHREHIQLCEEKLGIKLPDFVAICLKSIQKISVSLDL